jgi:hypothetical protein
VILPPLVFPGNGTQSRLHIKHSNLPHHAFNYTYKLIYGLVPIFFWCLFFLHLTNDDAVDDISYIRRSNANSASLMSTLLEVKSDKVVIDAGACTTNLYTLVINVVVQ